MPWESVTIPLTADLHIRAEFERVAGTIEEFRVLLERVQPDGATEWIVRYETHGGAAHKHERWNDGHEGRHKKPKGWTGTHAQLVDRAIDDIQQHHEDYEGRYEQWKQANAEN